MKNKTLTYVAVGLFGLILLLLVVGYMLGWFSKKLGFVEGEGELNKTDTAYFNIAKNASINLKGVNVSSAYMINVSKELLALNNNELREVVDQYNKHFSDKEGATLKTLIQAEWVGAWGICSHSENNDISSACYYQKKIVDRLTSINA